MKTYNLYKKIEVQTTGSPEDESESDEVKTSWYLVPYEEEDAFQEMCASDYGYQDYSYKVEYVKIGTFSENSLVEIYKLIQKEVVVERL